MCRDKQNLSSQIDPDDTVSTSQWWIPLSWAITMVNRAFNEKDKVLIPKDHKDVVTAIVKFRDNLHLLAEYRLRPLPAIYKQV